MNKKVLHITNDYAGSSVYKNLIGELDKLGIPQCVYTPLRDSLNCGENAINLATPTSEIIYSPILNSTTDRAFYRKKIKKIIADITAKVDLSTIGYIHAHTWFSDGGVAYLLSKKLNIPYLITIRNTDLNVFYNYLIHERKFGKKIILNAQQLVFISPHYKKRVFNYRLFKGSQQLLASKSSIISNGVNSYWLKNKLPFSPKGKGSHLLYVGKFTKGKNLPLVQQAIIELYKEGEKEISLSIVGEGGSQANRIKKFVKSYPNLFTFYGKIRNKDKLHSIFLEADAFVMPSNHETFGLVYVEAMLHGLPILYTKNEGIDGLYPNTIGEKVSQFTVAEIKQKIKNLIYQQQKYNIPLEELTENHDWKKIALRYKEMYKVIC